MIHRRRIWVGVSTTTLVCALVAGTAFGERARPAKRGDRAARAARKAPARPPAPQPRVDESAPLVEQLHSSWIFFESLADWQLRDDLDAPSYGIARRALSMAAALASARPGAAIAAALTPAPPVLEQRPVSGGVRSAYGVRRDPFKRRRWKKHNGVDLVAARGVPVLAAGPGMVAKAERLRGYGRVVFLDHGNGVQTRYAHLQKIAVQEGQFVPPGGLVGKVGSSGRATGPHLHFEVRANGKPVAPVEILALLTAHTPLALWLETIMDGELESPPAQTAQVQNQVEADKSKKARRKRGGKSRGRHAARSRRPNS